MTTSRRFASRNVNRLRGTFRPVRLQSSLLSLTMSKTVRAIQNWPEQRLRAEQYNEVIGAVQENEELLDEEVVESM